MRIGTKSLLFGVHQFLLHPLWVALAWWKLFGFPWDPRLWIAFFVHDIGYWGRPNMDGPEGETHVLLGSRVMGIFGIGWRRFTLYHSRFWARNHREGISRLCLADKYVICLTPWFLYLPLAWLTGEIKEYQKVSKHQEDLKSVHTDGGWREDRWWYKDLQDHMLEFIRDNIEETEVWDAIRGWGPRTTDGLPVNRASNLKRLWAREKAASNPESEIF